jgi:hypothetical protein
VLFRSFNQYLLKEHAQLEVTQAIIEQSSITAAKLRV